jgi:outer membrane protein assembly factor BamD (BamD/ComL family)
MFTYPGASHVDYYIFRMGMSEAGNRLWADALFYFDRVRNEYPTGQWADDATLQSAYVWWDQRRDYRKDLTPVLNCSDQLDIFFDRYPGSDLVEDAQELRSEVNSYLARRALFTGRFYARRQRYDAALLYLREALNDYGQPDCLPSILIALGDVYASKGNDYTARQFYQRAIDQCDLSQSQLDDVQSKLDDL